jgi:hypothetical protein
MQARAHEVVEIDSCPVLAPSMGEALPAARAIAQALAASGKPLDILFTASALDVDLKGYGPRPRLQHETRDEDSGREHLWGRDRAQECHSRAWRDRRGPFHHGFEGARKDMGRKHRAHYFGGRNESRMGA